MNNKLNYKLINILLIVLIICLLYFNRIFYNKIILKTKNNYEYENYNINKKLRKY